MEAVIVVIVAGITVVVLFVVKTELNGLLWGRRRATYIDPDKFKMPQCSCKSYDLFDTGNDPNDPNAGYRYRCNACGTYTDGGIR